MNLFSSWDGKVILDYRDRPNVIVSVFFTPPPQKKKSGEGRQQLGRDLKMQLFLCCLEDGRRDCEPRDVGGLQKWERALSPALLINKAEGLHLSSFPVLCPLLFKGEASLYPGVALWCFHCICVDTLMCIHCPSDVSAKLSLLQLLISKHSSELY